MQKNALPQATYDQIKGAIIAKQKSFAYVIVS